MMINHDHLFPSTANASSGLVKHSLNLHSKVKSSVSKTKRNGKDKIFKMNALPANLQRSHPELQPLKLPGHPPRTQGVGSWSNSYLGSGFAAQSSAEKRSQGFLGLC